MLHPHLFTATNHIEIVDPPTSKNESSEGPPTNHSKPGARTKYEIDTKTMNLDDEIKIYPKITNCKWTLESGAFEWEK